MTKAIIAGIMIAASVLAVSTGAEAGARHDVGFHGKGAVYAEHRGKHFKKKHHWKRHFHGGWVHIGRPHHNCGYYLWKAQYTGANYWWKKYRYCVRR